MNERLTREQLEALENRMMLRVRGNNTLDDVYKEVMNMIVGIGDCHEEIKKNKRVRK